MCETRVTKIIENYNVCRNWLEKLPGLMSHAVYTYLRLIVDHVGSSMANLRQKEVDFCVGLLRDKVAVKI